MNAAAVALAGTLKSKILNMENTKKIYRIPRDKSDQAISDVAATARTERASGPGHKQQVSSSKPQAPSFKRQASEASSDKPQAPSYKRQA